LTVAIVPPWAGGGRISAECHFNTGPVAPALPVARALAASATGDVASPVSTQAVTVMESRRERLQQCTIPASVHASAVAQVGAGLILRALLWLAPGLSMLACVDLSFV